MPRRERPASLGSASLQFPINHDIEPLRMKLSWSEDLGQTRALTPAGKAPWLPVAERLFG